VKKVVIIGVDGMDPNLVSRWKNELQYLKKLHMNKMESIFPPDSVSAWVTIFTGLNPAQHGLVHSIDYLDSRAKNFAIDTSILKGRTFWDLAGNAGRKVCIINPFLAHPTWNVNGIMVSGPVFITDKIDAFPEIISKTYKIPPLGGIVDFPTKKTLNDFCERTKKETKDLAEFGLKLLRECEWDLYFVTFLTLDRIQHFLWRYYDKNDPTYPGENQYHWVIKEFYKLFDELIGKFMSSIDNDTILIVLSDHGHGRRCIKSLNLNEFLRRKGYLISSVKGVRFMQLKYWLEKAKMMYLNFVYKHELEDIALKLTRYVPRKTEFKKSTYITDFDTSIAWIEKDFSGMNPFGGVKLDKHNIEKRRLNYGDVKYRVMKEIDQIKDDGRKTVKWIATREEIYQGEFIDRYPDIVFELDADYGLGFSLYLPIISLNVTHKKISGGHTRQGVFLISDCGMRFKTRDLSVLDIAPIVLDILNVRCGAKSHG
jgi:predicted AlkP superfamily phosphohydrolase/phosphomutase